MLFINLIKSAIKYCIYKMIKDIKDLSFLILDKIINI
jgi:hypothetical protein